jgi:hypothetical protein
VTGCYAYNRGMGNSSVLDDDTLADIIQDAAAHRSPFIDPKLLRDAEQVAYLATDEWLSRVIGRPVTAPAWRRFSNLELAVMVHAIRVDRAHLEALADAQRAEWDRQARERAEEGRAAAQAEWDGWVALRGRLPVPVVVEHNWTARHLDGYEQGADHIVVLEPLHVGRLHREAAHPLCWTPSRAHQLRHVGHAFSDDERRVPDCKACLRHAGRLAGR